MVKCQNFGDKCDWTGELREALEHQTKCCKDETTLNNPLQEEFLKQLINRMVELEVKVKDNGRKLVERDTQIVNQNKQIENLEKQIVNLNKHNTNQDKQIAEQKKQIESLQRSQTNSTSHQISSNQKQLSMIIPNIVDESNYFPICTAFRWKFNPADVKSGMNKFSPPFYNHINAYCFQLGVFYEKNSFRISLRRYRGKYDHNVNDIRTTKDFNFRIHIFGKNSKLKIFEFENDESFSVSKHEIGSKGFDEIINNGEISSLTVNGYVHLHCFFDN